MEEDEKDDSSDLMDKREKDGPGRDSWPVKVLEAWHILQTPHTYQGWSMGMRGGGAPGDNAETWTDVAPTKKGVEKFSGMVRRQLTLQSKKGMETTLRESWI